MRGTSRPGRGERGRVAERVRELLGDPAGDTAPPPFEDGPSGWLPDREMSLPGHSETRAGTPHRVDRVPLRDRLRWDPGRRPVAALAAAVLIVLVASVWWYLGSRPDSQSLPAGGLGSGAVPVSGAVPPSGLPLASSAASASPAPASPSATTVVVDVAGKVRRPGIYRLPADSRVYDALRAAGGPRRGVNTVSLNLAAPVQDGQQIVVGGPAAPVAPGAVVPDAAPPTTAVIDLNTASLEQLETLPGVGPVLGQHILDWRAAHGRFDTVDQLQEVSGIGDVRFAELHDLVSV